MREIICDQCKKKIDLENDVYYSIEMISFAVPSKKRVEVSTIKEGDKTTWIQSESWAIYESLDFCKGCWDKPGMKSVREVIKQKRELI